MNYMMLSGRNHECGKAGTSPLYSVTNDICITILLSRIDTDNLTYDIH